MILLMAATFSSVNSMSLKKKVSNFKLGQNELQINTMLQLRRKTVDREQRSVIEAPISKIRNGIT